MTLMSESTSKTLDCKNKGAVIKNDLFKQFPIRKSTGINKANEWSGGQTGLSNSPLVVRSMLASEHEKPLMSHAPITVVKITITVILIVMSGYSALPFKSRD